MYIKSLCDARFQMHFCATNITDVVKRLATSSKETGYDSHLPVEQLLKKSITIL